MNFKRYIYSLELIFFRKYLLFKSNHSSKILKNPFDVVDIPVKLINYGISEGLRKKKILINKVPVAGLIMKGGWDLKKFDLDNHFDFIAFKERFILKKEWEETIFKDIYNRDGKIRGCFSWENYKEKFLERWDRLYDDIKNNGYKSQNDSNFLESREGYKYDILEGKNINEVEVGITRKGEFVLINGKHRMAIARILKLKKIPAIISVCHSDFLEKVNNKKTGPQDIINYIVNQD